MTRSLRLASFWATIALLSLLSNLRSQTYTPAVNGQWAPAFTHANLSSFCNSPSNFNAFQMVLISKDTSSTGTNLRGWVFMMDPTSAQGTAVAQQRYSLLDPTTQTFINRCKAMPGANQYSNLLPPPPAPSGDISCSHHVTTRDGDILIAGGAIWNIAGNAFDGSKLVYVWDPAQWNQAPQNFGWTQLTDLAQQRYYPTVIVGRTQGNQDYYYIAGGMDSPNATPIAPSNYEVYKRTSAGAGIVFDTDLPGNRIYTGPVQATSPVESGTFHWYPWLHLMTTGEFFMAGFSRNSGKALHNPLVISTPWNYASGTVATQHEYSNFGSSVLLPINLNASTPVPNRVMRVGGGWSYGPKYVPPYLPLKTVEICDASVAGTWSPQPDLTVERLYCNTVLLPDGTILVLGGKFDSAGVPPSDWNLYSELLIGNQRVPTPPMDPRIYHSTAMLLPDGRVLYAGGNGRLAGSDYQIYSPPYLFKGARPVITGSWPVIKYDPTGSVEHTLPYVFSEPGTMDYIEKVVLMRPGSTTHHYDSEQRCLELKQALNAPAGSVTFYAPPNSNYAPPGYYMLFLVSQAGSVSVATWVQVLP